VGIGPGRSVVSNPPVSVGDRITVHLESLAVGGEAVGRHEGLAVFALWGCPGDVAEVEITEVARSFARGVVHAVAEPSGQRVEAPCPHFGDCGGCQIQHVAYEEQLRQKTAMVKDALARIGGMPEVEVAEAWGMEKPWFYRNRAEYHAKVNEAGELVLGFARHHSHEIVELTECHLQHPLSEQIRKAVVGLMARVTQSPAERAALLGVETLVSFASGEGLVTLVCDGRPAFVGSLAEALREEVAGVVGVLAARRRGHAAHRSPAEVVSGVGHVVEEIAGGKHRVSADSFFQSNPAQAGKMVELVREWARVERGEVVLDLYSGVGTFLLPLSRAARRGIGVEESESAVQDARANVRTWGLRNVTLYERKVERLLPRLAERGKGADVIVLDPPRKGCGPIVAAYAAKLRPRRMVLVSCHPATLARDLKSLAENGYVCRRVQPVDMFPQTWHVEAVGVCELAQT
jgi:23S rRNA (uracil1939-C5)-methyltransferase